MNIEQRIQQLRKEKGLSQEQLADQLHISRQAVSKWESGQSLPDIEKIVALSEYFGVTTDYLLKGKDEPNHTVQIQNNEKISKEVNILGTFLLAVGLLCIFANWYENQSMKDVLAGFIIQAVGVAAYFVGKIVSNVKLSNIWLWCNGMMLAFVPLSLLVGIFVDYPTPYPISLFGLISFSVLYPLVGFGLYIALKKYEK